MSAVVAMVAVFLLAANAAFQVALAVGLPWGHAAYGGSVALDDGSLPTRYRVASLVSALFMGLLVCLALVAGGLVDTEVVGHRFVTWASVGAGVLFVLNTAGNLASSSRIERWVMGPATAALAGSFGLLAWGL